ANMSSSILSSEIFASLYNFLKTSSSDKITISNIITQKWKFFKIQTEEEDLDCLTKILEKAENEIVDKDRKFEEEVNWKDLALKNIHLLMDKIKKKDTPTHGYIFTKLSNIEVDKLSKDDPLCIGVIDLSSNKYNLSESDYESIVGTKANIRNLNKDAVVENVCNDFISKRDEIQKLRKFVLRSKDVVTHDQWVEYDHIKERIAKGITDVLLQEIKLNALNRGSEGSENTLVEIIALLIDMAMFYLPVDYEVEVTRSERQSIASKNRKVQQKKGARGNKPDLMFRAYLRQKWEEIVFFESGKWDSDEDKIRHDHSKLVQFCLDGSKELVKKCTKEVFHQNYIGFGVNIAGKYLEIHGLIKESGIKYYLPVVKAKIPLDNESFEEVEEFVHALLILRNIVNSFQKRSREEGNVGTSSHSDTSIPKSPINSVTPQSSVSPPIEGDSNANNRPNVTQHTCSESKTLEEKEDDEFIDLVYKEKELLLDSADTSPNISHEQKNIQSISNESGDREPEG
ncbi:9225_t:CDS:2, partial [Racocetra persica]